MNERDLEAYDRRMKQARVADSRAERTAFASVRLALVTADRIQPASAMPLFRGWWRVVSAGYACEVKEHDKRKLAEAVQLRLGHLGVQRVYGPRARATKRAHDGD